MLSGVCTLRELLTTNLSPSQEKKLAVRVKHKRTACAARCRGQGVRTDHYQIVRQHTGSGLEVPVYVCVRQARNIGAQA